MSVLIKMNKIYDNIRLAEHSNGAILVRSLTGKYITIINSKIDGYKEELERIDRLQGKRMKLYGNHI